MKNPLSERTILSYDDVAQYSAGDSDEQLVKVNTYNSTLVNQYMKLDMVSVTGRTIYTRDAIAQKLTRIDAMARNKGYRLKIVYGYRHPSVQQKYFEDRKSILLKDGLNLPEDELDKYVHNFVAAPNIAGHPAGAAVDLTLITPDGSDVDMGTGIADYSDKEKIRTFASDLTEEQASNRKLLHDLMVYEDFAPFYGEWWHFSYGDREWAAFYNKKALYGAIDFNI